MGLLSLISEPQIFVVFMLAIVFALTVHEFAHAAMAKYWGDDTAEHLGRLTLNPLAHIDWVGALFLVLVGFGWGKPVPVNPNRFRNQRLGEITVAFAGPLSNFLLATIFGLAWKYFAVPMLGSENLLSVFLVLSFSLNMLLMVFNLLPLPPLDGFHIIFNILFPQWWKVKQFLLVYGSFVFIGLIILGNITGVSFFGWIQVITGLYARLLGIA
jgi:Zn-dependent protease